MNLWWSHDYNAELRCKAYRVSREHELLFESHRGDRRGIEYLGAKNDKMAHLYEFSLAMHL